MVKQAFTSFWNRLSIKSRDQLRPKHAPLRRRMIEDTEKYLNDRIFETDFPWPRRHRVQSPRAGRATGVGIEAE